jgi:hypothetical protein
VRRSRGMSRRMPPQHFGLEQVHGLSSSGSGGNRRAPARRKSRNADGARAHRARDRSAREACRGDVRRGVRRGRPAARPCAGGSRPARASAAASRASPCPCASLRTGHPVCPEAVSRIATMAARCVLHPPARLRNRLFGTVCSEPRVSQAFRPSRHGGKYRPQASHGLRWRGPWRRTLRP